MDRVEDDVSRANVVEKFVAAHYGAAIAGCMALGVLIRAFHVLGSDFPLNDGGLFYVMTRDLQSSNYVLPSFTTYNGGDIPFAYPPLGFYFAGLLDHLTPLNLVGAFRVGPWLATSLTLPAFYLVARSLLSSKVAIVAAVFAFAVIPRAYIWLLMGGGLTRAFGFLFALLAIYCLYLCLKEGQRRAVVWTSVFCGLTVLSHLEAAWFLAFSAAVFAGAWARTREDFVNCAIIGAATVAISAPWWGTVIANHGLEPFLAASETGGTVLSGGEATRWAYTAFLRFISTSEPLFPLTAVLALFGLLSCLVTRRFLLPAWWAAIILLDIRSSATYSTVPVALLAGIGVTELLLPLLLQRPRVIEQTGWEEDETAEGEEGVSRDEQRRPVPAWASVLVLVALVVYSGTSALLRTSWLGAEAQILEGLSAREREAMAWAREAPAGSRFLIVPDSIWQTAKASEWFPALSGQLSVGTVQGTEWVSDKGFERALEVHEDAFQCGFRTTACLDELSETHGLAFDYVYVRQIGERPCCYTLVTSLEEDAGYEEVFENDAVVIFRAM